MGYAKFPPDRKFGAYGTTYVDFTPAEGDVRSINHCGTICYYRDGFWYVQAAMGVPSSKSEGVTWPAPVVTPTAQDYPDGNPKSLQGAKKYSLRYLPLSASVEVNRALEDGAKKYGPANWRAKGVATSVYIDAAQRHISLYFDCKQNNASDSGVHNLGHAMACLAIIIDAEKAGTLTDDRPFPFPDGDALLMRS